MPVTNRAGRDTQAGGISRNLLLFASAALTIALAGCSPHNHTSQVPAQTPVPTAPGAPFPAPQPANPPNNSSPSGPPSAVERQPAIPGEYEEEGVASWYGIPFNGHRTSNGEIYDMHQMTAAHRTLPFGSLVRVTNLHNGMQTEVRINDRGPFVADRVIDLSLSAAQAIQMIGTGTAQVRLELVSGSNPTEGFFGVQVGAFLVQKNAEKFRAQLGAKYPSVSMVTYDSPNGLYYRVRVGRVSTESAAQQLAAQLHANEQLTTFVVRLDN
jgi:rare lipoprotein A